MRTGVCKNRNNSVFPPAVVERKTAAFCRNVPFDSSRFLGQRPRK